MDIIYKQQVADARVTATKAQPRCISYFEEGDVKKQEGESPGEAALGRKKGNLYLLTRNQLPNIRNQAES